MTREEQFGENMVGNHEYITGDNRGEDLLFVFFFLLLPSLPIRSGKTEKRIRTRGHRLCYKQTTQTYKASIIKVGNFKSKAGCTRSKK